MVAPMNLIISSWMKIVQGLLPRFRRVWSLRWRVRLQKISGSCWIWSTDVQRYLSLGYYERDDLAVVVDHLRESNRVTCIGAVLGGSESVLAALKMLKGGCPVEVTKKGVPWCFHNCVTHLYTVVTFQLLFPAGHLFLFPDEFRSEDIAPVRSLGSLHGCLYGPAACRPSALACADSMDQWISMDFMEASGEWMHPLSSFYIFCPI